MKSVHTSEAPLHIPPGFPPYRYEIKLLNLEECYDILFGSSVGTPIKETPHYKYATGDKTPLKEYFEKCRGFTWARPGTPAENMTVDELCEEFEVLLNSDKGYLEPPYESHYIIVKNDRQLIDGTRRACTLLSNGITHALAAFVI
jgi:hypothetical protein|tara:strand:+ start:301 stop:735 length:435 start_codon:yes stop_codon:yes gene_type:complete